MPDLQLEDKDLRLILQSLQHCLATCKQRAAGGGPCADCDAAAALRDRIQALVKKNEVTQ